MKPLKEKISITIDGDVLERLKEESEKDDRSLSQYINIVLKHHLAKIKNTNKQPPPKERCLRHLSFTFWYKLAIIDTIHAM